MKTLSLKILILSVLVFSWMNAPALAQDEAALFTAVAPDALLILDRSGSMLWTPAGEYMYIDDAYSCNMSVPFYTDPAAGRSRKCTISTSNVPKFGDTACLGPFYHSSGTGHETDCSRIAIAKRSIFQILDDNQSGTISNADETSMNVRLGYMRFYGCSSDDTGNNYNDGCNKVVQAIGARFSNIWSSVNDSSVTASGGTPLASSLHEAKLYLDDHKASDNAAACRQKFVILVTDGADTFACGGDGTEDQTTQYKRRREAVAKAKALSDAGYRTFVIGFGTGMPHFLRNTLNWMGYFGSTKNTAVDQTGSTTAYNPANVTSCADDPNTATHNIEGDYDHTFAVSNDPGEYTLSGYAFLTSNAEQLSEALRYAINVIREADYSFSSMASVSSSRTTDENYIYEASFQPVNNEPFWHGHLKKYAINADGTVGGMIWDAGTQMRAQADTTRTMKTITDSGLVSFETGTASITTALLGASSDTQRTNIINYFRGAAAYNPDDWKLGDIFRSNPITIATPSAYWTDVRDTNNAFATFRSSHVRSSSDGTRTIIVGANDGQIHNIRASDGTEAWSFIPPNFLPKLKNVAHATHPVIGLSHIYFVDGPVSVAEVWLGSGDGTSKNPSNWKTLAMIGEGRGAGGNLWSSSPSCSTGFNATYTSTYNQYCGYYIIDVTDTGTLSSVWRIYPDANAAPYLGDPWSRPYVGRLVIGGQETWVAFIGGGFNASNCHGGGACDTRGKGFFVVRLSDGAIIWKHTYADDTSNMIYSFAGGPAIVDTDDDGLIDTVYAADLGGNIWRFKFCLSSQVGSCSTSSFQATRLFNSTGNVRPIYTMPAVAKDGTGTIWVYFGTGDKTDPTAANAQERFYGVKDTDRVSTWTAANLVNLGSSGTFDPASNSNGWFFNLSGSGQKILADPTVFGGVAYFTSYTPASGNDPCSQAGAANLWAVNYITGGGMIDGSRSTSLGSGIPTAPIISQRPGSGTADLYVTVSGGAGISANTQRASFSPPSSANRSNLIYWRDLRLR